MTWNILKTLNVSVSVNRMASSIIRWAEILNILMFQYLLIEWLAILLTDTETLNILNFSHLLIEWLAILLTDTKTFKVFKMFSIINRMASSINRY